MFAEYIFATLPRTQRGQPLVLGGDPKGKNFLYTNGNSVIIRNIDVSIVYKIIYSSPIWNTKMQCYLIHFLFLESSYCRYLYRTFMSSQCCKIFPKWVLYSIRWYVQS